MKSLYRFCRWWRYDVWIIACLYEKWYRLIAWDSLVEESHWWKFSRDYESIFSINPILLPSKTFWFFYKRQIFGLVSRKYIPRSTSVEFRLERTREYSIETFDFWKNMDILWVGIKSHPNCRLYGRVRSTYIWIGWDFPFIGDLAKLGHIFPDGR